MKNTINEQETGSNIFNRFATYLRGIGGGSKPAVPSAPATATPSSGATATTDAAASATNVGVDDKTKQTTSTISLPQAIVIKQLLTKELAAMLYNNILSGFSKEERKKIATPIMNYLNNLPNLSNKILAEAAYVAGQKGSFSPEQQLALKNKLVQQHNTNFRFVSKNLQTLHTQIFNKIKNSLDANKAVTMLNDAILKQYGNKKEAVQYTKSLMSKPELHLEALLASIQLVLDNVMLILQNNMPKQQSNLAQPKVNEAKLISESTTNRWQVLANIKK